MYRVVGQLTRRNIHYSGRMKSYVHYEITVSRAAKVVVLEGCASSDQTSLEVSRMLKQIHNITALLEFLVGAGLAIFFIGSYIMRKLPMSCLGSGYCYPFRPIYCERIWHT